MNSLKLKQLEFEIREFNRVFENFAETLKDAQIQYDIMVETMKIIKEKLKNMREEYKPAEVSN